MRVVVAVPTAGRRPVRPLLRALTRQGADAAGSGHDVVVMLIGNGPQGSDAALRGACREVGVRYVSHPPPGFAEARNRALDEAARLGADAIAMIDDDEMPDPTWLQELIRAAAHWNVDIAIGPVATAWPADVPSYVRRANLPPRPDRPLEGPIADDLRSGNCLIRLTRIGHIRFDPRFNLTGGEDVAYFRRARADGARAVWVPSAVVYETPDADRRNARYLLRRARENGRTWRRLRHGNTDERVRAPALEASRRMAKGSALAAAGMLRVDRANLLQCGWEFAFVVGMFDAIWHRPQKTSISSFVRSSGKCATPTSSA